MDQSPPPQTRPAGLERFLPWAGPSAIAVAGLVMLRWTWLKWPDVLIDYGQQLYIAWRIAQGAVLYRDLAYFHGPLGPYLSGLWFRLLGPGLLTLAAMNLVVLGAIAALLYRVLLAIGDRLSAAAAGLAFMTLFAFSQYSLVGNFNYAAPYEQNVTCGMLAALGALALLRRSLRHPSLAATAGSGLCLGLVSITKAELFLAAAGALALGLGLALRAEHGGRRRALRTVAAFAVPALLAPVAAALLLRTAMPWREAIMGTLGSWPAILHGKAVGLRMHRESMGTLDLGHSLMQMALMTAVEAGVLALACVIALKARRTTAMAAAGAFVLFGALAWTILENVPADRIFLPLPLLAVAAGAVGLWRLWRHRGAAGGAARTIAQVTFIAFALLLLLKNIFNARLYHYGFALAMPATLLAVVVLTAWIPAWIGQGAVIPGVFRAAALAVLAALVLVHLRISATAFGLKNCVVADQRDRFLADCTRGPRVNEALAEIRGRLRADQTLAVLPEGVMLNYLARRVNPTPHTNFMPDGLAIFGEDSILRSFQEHPPDFVALAHKDTSDFGSPLFGRDYGQSIARWIDANYEQVWLTGHPPLRNVDEFGIALLQRGAARGRDAGRARPSSVIRLQNFQEPPS